MSVPTEASKRAPKPLSNDAYAATRQVVAGLASTILLLPLAELVSAAETADAVGPVLDPTLWKKAGANLNDEIEIFQAFAALQGTLVRVRDRNAARRKGRG